MFQRILVPIDGTPQASAALPAARTLARATGASVVLVRVSKSASAAERATAEKATVAVRDELAGSDLQVDTLMRSGDAAEEIVAATQAASADLIVMATHGRTGLRRAFAGSVTERVLANSPVPVVVLKPGGKRMSALRSLLIPVDATAGGALALGAASGLARTASARVTVLEVVQPMPVWMYGSVDAYAPAGYIDPAWEDDAASRSASYVNALSERLRAAGLQADGRSARGQVAATIESVADELDSDLIVMSTHALTGPARAVLGSVADEVVRNSRRPVLMVRRPGGALDEDAPDEAAAEA
jgi:nucleotide-binding universal stress UspA family protein